VNLGMVRCRVFIHGMKGLYEKTMLDSRTLQEIVLHNKDLLAQCLHPTSIYNVPATARNPRSNHSKSISFHNQEKKVILRHRCEFPFILTSSLHTAPHYPTPPFHPGPQEPSRIFHPRPQQHPHLSKPRLNYPQHRLTLMPTPPPHSTIPAQTPV
jgi:hypothetical protein